MLLIYYKQERNKLLTKCPFSQVRFYNDMSIRPIIMAVDDFGCRQCDFNFCKDQAPSGVNNSKAILCTFEWHYLT